MNYRVFVIFILLTIPAFTQEASDTALQQAVNGLLHGGDVFGVAQYKMPKFSVAEGPGKDFNAFADPANNTITITRPLLNVLEPSELAFVIAHEIGHLQDSGCPARGAAHHLSGVALKRMCEASADKIAVQYLMAAGYSAFDGAGVMGKLLMTNQNETSVMGIVFGRFLSDHPVSVDRIRQLAQYAKEVCQDRPEVCAHIVE